MCLQTPSCSVPTSAVEGVEAPNPATAATLTVPPAAPDLTPPTAWSESETVFWSRNVEYLRQT